MGAWLTVLGGCRGGGTGRTQDSALPGQSALLPAVGLRLPESHTPTGGRAQPHEGDLQARDKRCFFSSNSSLESLRSPESQPPLCLCHSVEVWPWKIMDAFCPSVWNYCSGWALLLGSRGRDVWPSDEKETQEGNERNLRRG